MQATGMRSAQGQVICSCSKLSCQFKCPHHMQLLSKEENEVNSNNN